MMKRIVLMLIGLSLFTSQSSAGQMQDGMLIFEQYDGVSSAEFQEYFELLKERYDGSDMSWGIYQAENPRVAFRVTAVPEGGMQGVLDVLDARVRGFDAFTGRLNELWGTAWQQRRQMIFSNAPDLSVVPDDFGYSHVESNPYARIYMVVVNPGDIQTFENAHKRIVELDAQLGNNEGRILRVYRGGLGSPAPAYLLFFHGTDLADFAAREERQNAARATIAAEWQEAWDALVKAARDVVIFETYRANALSAQGNLR